MKEVKYCFGLCQERCFGDTFDTIEELVEFAEDCWKNPDGNYWDEDMDDYTDTIFIGVADFPTPHDVAPSLNDIADQMTDSFYCEYHIDDDADVLILNRQEAEKEWKEFVNKYFELPHSMTCRWIGTYDLKKHDWVEKFGKEG